MRVYSMYDLSGELTVILITVLVFAEVRERLEENNRHKFDVARFNLKKLRELEVMKRYQIKISKRFAALEKLNVSEDINRVWKNIAENIKTSAK